MKLILVPTDMSETAAHALRYASALADRFDAHLLVLYADPFTPPIDYTGTTIIPPREELVEAAREQLELHVEQNVSPRVPYDARVLAQSTVDAIVEQACDTGADLIVMGTHGRTGLRRFFIGSVTEAVIRLATVPVIALNSFSSENPLMQKVVCPVTFTTSSLEALRYAASLAGTASLLLYRGVEGTQVRDTVDELIALDGWIPKDLVDRTKMKIVSSPSSPDDIANFAKRNNADLIALGIPAAPHLLESLLHSCGCPVLTVNELTARLAAPDQKLPLSAVAAATQ
jgi:nucleotide-binding universal stress UspA family protein